MNEATTKRLNFGCGRDYRDGWVNADVNPKVRADVYLNPKDGRIPFEDNTFDEILLDNVLEHIGRDRIFTFLDELHRISRAGAILRIYVPHYTSVFAYANLSHCTTFAIGAFDCCTSEGGIGSSERYGKAVFRVRRQRLLFFGHNPVRMRVLGKLPINWLFNVSWLWQKMMERFQVFGFDEVYFELDAVK